MKYIFCATALLLTLAICCCAVVWRISELTTVISTQLQNAEEALRRGDFELTEAYVSEAHRCWLRHQGFCGTVIRHAETDTLSEALTLALFHAKLQNRVELQSLLVTLQSRLQHLSDMEQAHYYNFL